MRLPSSVANNVAIPGNVRLATTLNEVLVVLFVISIICALGMTYLTKVQEASSRIRCQNNLRQLGIAANAYNAIHKSLPPYATGSPGEIYGGWFVHLLPHCDFDPLFQRIADHDRKSRKILSPAVYAPDIANIRFQLLQCVSDPTSAPKYGTTNYLANWFALARGDHGAFSSPRKMGDMIDGPSNVVLFAEAYSNCKTAIRHTFQPPRFHNFGITGDGKPSDDASLGSEDYVMFELRPAKCDGWRAQTAHDVMHASMVDASVRVVAGDIDPKGWWLLLRPDNGNPIAD